MQRKRKGLPCFAVLISTSSRDGGSEVDGDARPNEWLRDTLLSIGVKKKNNKNKTNKTINKQINEITTQLIDCTDLENAPSPFLVQAYRGDKVKLSKLYLFVGRIAISIHFNN